MSVVAVLQMAANYLHHTVP